MKALPLIFQAELWQGCFWLVCMAEMFTCCLCLQVYRHAELAVRDLALLSSGEVSGSWTVLEPLRIVSPTRVSLPHWMLIIQGARYMCPSRPGTVLKLTSTALDQLAGRVSLHREPGLDSIAILSHRQAPEVDQGLGCLPPYRHRVLVCQLLEGPAERPGFEGTAEVADVQPLVI